MKDLGLMKDANPDLDAVRKEQLEHDAWLAQCAIDWCRENGHTDLRSVRRFVVRAIEEQQHPGNEEDE